MLNVPDGWHQAEADVHVTLRLVRSDRSTSPGQHGTIGVSIGTGIRSNSVALFVYGVQYHCLTQINK